MVRAENICSALFNPNKSVTFFNNPNMIESLVGKEGDFYFDQDLFVRGKLNSVAKDSREQVSYYALSGPVEIQYKNKVLPGQDTLQHAHGFGNPLGSIQSVQINQQVLLNPDLSQMTFQSGDQLKIIYASGVEVNGILSHVEKRQQKNLIMTFQPESCEVIDAERKVLFDRSWGVYDLILAKQFSTAVTPP
jgi:phenylalanine-4-hydroxylase